MTGAGLLGYLAPGLPGERVAEAARRAPWRGNISTTLAGPAGALHALGKADAARHGHVAVVLHGRLDNLTRLREEMGLDVAAHPCAVTAEAYLRHGDDFAGRLIGDFALLLLDERRGALLAARDWVGTRPLFWGEKDGEVAWGSEVKQVLALLGQPSRPDERTLAAYERMAAPALTATFAAGISAVPPSGQVLAEAGRPVRVWRRAVRFAPVELSLAEAAAAVRVGLEVAVSRRAAGAACLGALISGGMDSTTVAATAAALGTRGEGPRLAAGFTTAYPDVPEIDETAYARAVAERWGVAWTPVTIRPADLLAWPDRGFAAHDGPTFPGFGMYDTLMEAARAAGVDVLLTGNVGDYWVRQDGRELEQAILRGDWRAALTWGLHGARSSPARTARRSLRAAAKRLLRRERAEAYYEDRAADYWLRASLESQEREGMRHGLQVEHPFCDFELATLLAGLPPRVRSSPRTPLKLVIREATRDLLPELVRTRADNPVSTPFFVAALGDRARDGTALGNANVLTEAAARYVAAWHDQITGT
jgi:asparagine synthetase B (glutamine-hydrolysing)